MLLSYKLQLRSLYVHQNTVIINALCSYLSNKMGKSELWTMIQFNYTIWRLSVPNFNNGSTKEIEGEPENGNLKNPKHKLELSYIYRILPTILVNTEPSQVYMEGSIN